MQHRAIEQGKNETTMKHGGGGTGLHVVHAATTHNDSTQHSRHIPAHCVSTCVP